jgi:hypothetical protein
MSLQERGSTYTFGAVSSAGLVLWLFFLSLFWFPFAFGDPFVKDAFVDQSTIQRRLGPERDFWPWQLKLAVWYSDAVWSRMTFAIVGFSCYVVLLCWKPNAIVTAAVFHLLMWVGVIGAYICFAGVFAVV